MKTAFAIVSAFLVSVAVAPATTIFFDTLSAGPMPTNYSGFEWSGWVTVSPTTGTPSGDVSERHRVTLRGRGKYRRPFYDREQWSGVSVLQFELRLPDRCVE